MKVIGLNPGYLHKSFLLYYYNCDFSFSWHNYSMDTQISTYSILPSQQQQSVRVRNQRVKDVWNNKKKYKMVKYTYSRILWITILLILRTQDWRTVRICSKPSSLSPTFILAKSKKSSQKTKMLLAKDRILGETVSLHILLLIFWSLFQIPCLLFEAKFVVKITVSF